MPHKHWEKVVLAAYGRMMGLTQQATGATVGRSERTIQEWERDKLLWSAARDAARQRWLAEMTDAARVTLLNAIKAGQWFPAMQILERVDEDLAPAKQRVEVTDGGGLAALLAATTNGAAHANGTHSPA